MSEKKARILLISLILGVFIMLLIPKNANHISNAAINPNNGDIAFCYYDYSSETKAIRVEVYSKSGELLFSKVTGGDGAYADLLFIDDELYVSSGRDNRRYRFDRDGNEPGYDVPYKIFEETQKARNFDSWKFSLGKRTFQYEDYLYVYKPPMILRDKALLTVTNGDGEVTVIYKDPWYD